mmetsp:Transcript_1228/g.1681  ORF Transcript_1228/g.1681 Transcript_1228/m.1681 type:complete len:374 (+) Transcript_1228:73-1194(+)
MKTRLLFMRYYLVPLQQKYTARGCLHLVGGGNFIRPSSRTPSQFLLATNYHLSATRSHSSSSSAIASSFEAPEPPDSHGHPVFPHINFNSGENVNSLNKNSDSNAVFVVSGASRGIGLQFVSSLLERTQGKIIACCRSPAAADKLNKIASQQTDRIEVLPLDLEDQSTIDALELQLTKKYQRIDALFNVAGILGDGGISTPGPERSLASIERDWLEKSLAVNIVGPTMLVKALSPLMRTKGRRKITIDDDGEQLVVIPPTNRAPTVIVNLSARVGSISDNQLGGWYTYRSSKSALNQMTRTMAHELKRQGSYVIALHPGTTKTDLSKPFQKNVQDKRLFPVEFTVEKLLDVVDSVVEENNGGFYDWAGKALPF